MNAHQKADLLKDIIIAITETNATVVNVTCDGLSSNFSTFEKLGASFEINDLQPYFLNPVNNNEIYVLFDACHMLKLVRNCIQNKGTLKNNQNMEIKWAHFQQLEAVRIKNDFVTHKLTKKHIQCDRNKMSVPLAAQTLSKSVANSLQYLMQSGILGFENCAGTIEYASVFNDLFDILNSY